jgi:hypothetical protein
VNCVFTISSDTVGSTVHISGETVTGSETFEACDTLTVDNTTVTFTGDLTLHAGDTIILKHGFVVQSGGKATVVVEN